MKPFYLLLLQYQCVEFSFLQNSESRWGVCSTRMQKNLKKQPKPKYLEDFQWLHRCDAILVLLVSFPITEVKHLMLKDGEMDSGSWFRRFQAKAETSRRKAVVRQSVQEAREECQSRGWRPNAIPRSCLPTAPERHFTNPLPRCLPSKSSWWSRLTFALIQAKHRDPNEETLPGISYEKFRSGATLRV